MLKHSSEPCSEPLECNQRHTLFFLSPNYHVSHPSADVSSGLFAEAVPPRHFHFHLICSVDTVNLTPLQRQRNCYGFSESCSRYVLALHIAMGETRTLQIEADIPEKGSELCTVSSRLYKQEVLGSPEYNYPRRERNP